MAISAKIPLKVEQPIISEGTHAFTITNVDYDPTTGKVVIDLNSDQRDKNGEIITKKEYYNTLGDDGKLSSKVIAAFKGFVCAILDGYNDEEGIDPSKLVGVNFVADVSHTTQESILYPGKVNTYANLSNYHKAILEDDQLPF